MYNSYYAVIFAGINTNTDSFEQLGQEITANLTSASPDITVKTLTIYPYDDSVSGDTFADALQVVKNAYDLRGSTVTSMAKTIMENYSNEEYVFFVGYSGGGVAATKVAEKLARMPFPPVSRIVRVGSPVLTVGKSIYGKTVDIMLKGDPVVQLEILRFFKDFRPYQCMLKDLKVTRHIHSCYFKQDLVDDAGVSNLTKTTNKILKFIKN